LRVRRGAATMAEGRSSRAPSRCRGGGLMGGPSGREVPIGLLHSLTGNMAVSEIPLRDAELLAAAPSARGGAGHAPRGLLGRGDGHDPAWGPTAPPSGRT
jgi:hypothetical protein